MSINLNMALTMISTATEKAMSIGVPMYIAIVDQGGNLVAQHRMDGAILISETLSKNKAYTALSTKMETAELGKLAQPGQPLYGIETTQNGTVVIFGGGIPIYQDNEVIGAIGVSGGSVDQDIAVAKAGLGTLNS